MRNELLPCPFCGGEAYEYRSGWRFSLCEIVCKDCGCRTERMAVADAYAAWNTRKPMERIVERLEKLKNYEANGDCPRDGMCDKNLMNAQAVIQIQQSKS